MNRLPPERVWNAIVTAPAPPPTWAPAAASVDRDGLDGVLPRRDRGEEAVGVAQEVVVVAHAVERDADEASGRPLIVESRLVPVVLTPGRNATAFSALRVGVGMRVSWSEFSVAATVPFSVLISSELLVTMTVSSSCRFRASAGSSRAGRARRGPPSPRPS